MRRAKTERSLSVHIGEGRTVGAWYKPVGVGQSGAKAAADGKIVQIFVGVRGSHRCTPKEAKLLADELLEACKLAEEEGLG